MAHEDYCITPNCRICEGGPKANELIDPSNPLEEISQKELLEGVYDSFNSLTQNERTVLELRFGLDDKPSLTLQQIGDALGVTRERVRQLEKRALRKLREPEKVKGRGRPRKSNSRRIKFGVQRGPGRPRKDAKKENQKGI